MIVPALVAAILVATPALAIEEPGYEVVSKTNDYELRRYAPMLVAEVAVDGDFPSAGDRAFKILAGYIFGKNTASEKMNMTAPVLSSEPEESGVRMEMTSPVLSTEAGAKSEGAYVYAFVMESEYTKETLPRPNDSRIEIREVPARLVAAHRYSGRWTESNYRKHEGLMARALERDGLRPAGTFTLARYDAPFIPWFMRRNEVMVEIEPDSVRPDGAEAAAPSPSG
jgi:hypothetical protein